MASLQTDVVAAWHLDETGGDRADSHSTNTLEPTGNGALYDANGKRQGAVEFDGVIARRLTLKGSQDPLTFEDESFTIAFWYKEDVSSLAMESLITKQVAQTSAGFEYRIRRTGGSTRKLTWECKSTTASTSMASAAAWPPVASDWSLAVVGYNASTNLMFMSIDGGTMTTKAHAGGTHKYSTGGFSADFAIGADVHNMHTTPRALIDEVVVWEKALTQQEVTNLWSNKTGRFYPYNEASLTLAKTMTTTLQPTGNYQQAVTFAKTLTFAAAEALPPGPFDDGSTLARTMNVTYGITGTYDQALTLARTLRHYKQRYHKSAQHLSAFEHGMLAAYCFEEGDDLTRRNALDTEKSHDLMDQNAVGSTTGQLGNAAQFDRANTEFFKIVAANATELTFTSGDTFGIACWFRLDTWHDMTDGEQQVLVAKTKENNSGRLEYKLYLEYKAGRGGGITVTARWDDGAATQELQSVTFTVTAGNWTLVCFSLNGTDACLICKDIALSETKQVSASVASAHDNSADFFVGNWDGAGNAKCFDGEIDELIIFNRFVSSSQDSLIKTDLWGDSHYKTNVLAPFTIAHWAMDEIAKNRKSVANGTHLIEDYITSEMSNARGLGTNTRYERALDVVAAKKQRLFKRHHDDLNLAETDFTLCFSYHADQVGTNQDVLFDNGSLLVQHLGADGYAFSVLDPRKDLSSDGTARKGYVTRAHQQWGDSLTFVAWRCQQGVWTTQIGETRIEHASILNHDGDAFWPVKSAMPLDWVERNQHQVSFAGPNPAFAYGQNEYPDGQFDEFWIWERALDDTELRDACAGQGRQRVLDDTLARLQLDRALTAGLVHWYALGEGTGANRADGRHLTDLSNNFACTQEATIPRNGVNSTGFDGVNQSLSHLDHAAHSFPSSFTIAGWFKLDTLPSTEDYWIVAKADGPLAIEYLVWVAKDTDRLVFTVAGGYAGVSVYSTVDLLVDTIYCFAARFNHTTGEISIIVNGAKQTQLGAGSRIEEVANATFDIGGVSYVGPPTISTFVDGKIDDVAMWSRYLSDSEVDEFCNGTDGNPYPFGSVQLLLAMTRTYALAGIETRNALITFAKKLSMQLVDELKVFKTITFAKTVTKTPTVEQVENRTITLARTLTQSLSVSAAYNQNLTLAFVQTMAKSVLRVPLASCLEVTSLDKPSLKDKTTTAPSLQDKTQTQPSLGDKEFISC